MEHVGRVLVETYRVDRLIAEGGMAQVYEASHLRIPKRFAVKFLKMSLVTNSEALQRFRREAEIIATLDHPNIVNLVDYNVSEDGTPYIVMEFLDGEHVGKRLERGKLPLPEAIRICQAVGSALTAAHARDIVHRDLKPENIILCRGDVVKVVDFGVAKLRHGPELTAFNTILGTVAYMAPEQITAQKVDGRTDQYALANIVHELLSGARPPDNESVPQQAMKILYQQPPPLGEVPGAVNEVLFQAMAKDPGARFPSVKAFVDALLEAALAPRRDTDPEFAAVPMPDPLSTTGRILAGEALPPLAGEPTTVSLAPLGQDAADAPTEIRDSARPTGPTGRRKNPPSTKNRALDPLLASEEPTARATDEVMSRIKSHAVTLPPVLTPPDGKQIQFRPMDVTADTGPSAVNTGAGPGEDRLAMANTLKKRRGLSLWLWFVFGLAASGGVVAAVWFLLQRR